MKTNVFLVMILGACDRVAAMSSVQVKSSVSFASPAAGRNSPQIRPSRGAKTPGRWRTGLFGRLGRSARPDEIVLLETAMISDEATPDAYAYADEVPSEKCRHREELLNRICNEN